MEFLTDDFDAIWRHIQECAQDDAKKKNWIPSRRATKKNLIVEVGDTYLMVTHQRSPDDPRGRIRHASSAPAQPSSWRANCAGVSCAAVIP